MNDLADIPVAPPRHAKSFRRVGRWCVLAIAFLAPFSFFAGIEFLAIVAFICFLGCLLTERRIDYPRSLLFPFLILFLFLQAVSTWFSIARSQSLFGGLMAPDSLLSFVIYFLVFFLSFFFFRREGIMKIGMAIGAGLLVETLAGFWNFIHAIPSNPIGTSLGWGIVMIAVLGALAVIRPGELAGWVKFFFFLVAAVALAALVILNYQFLWITLAVFVMVLAALRFGPREHFQYAFAVIALALFFALIGSRLPAFPQASQDARPSISASLATVQGVLKGPAIFIGSGPTTFDLDFDAFRPANTNAGPFWAAVFPQGHDFAVTLLTTGGLLSFLLFLWLVILALQPFLHIQLLDTDLAMVISASAFLLIALFLYPATFGEFILLFLLLGMFHGTASHRTIAFDSLEPWKSFAMSLAVIVLAAITLAGAFISGEKYLALIFSNQSNQIAATGDFGDAFSKINAAIALDPSDAYYRSASSILISEAKVLAASTSSSVTAELPVVISNAIQVGESAITANPRDPANWGNLGSIYESVLPIATGADSSAANAYQQASVLDPSDPQWDLDIGRVFIESANLLPQDSSGDASRQADWASAETFLDKAIALKDDYADPRVLLVQLYLQEGNVSAAIEKVQELESQNPLDPGVAFELGYLYYEENQIPQAQQEFQLATILDPDYANAHYFLGLIDDENGMTAQALSQFQITLALNPGNTQITSIIANIEAGRPALPNDVATSTLSGVQAN